jgi:nicotinamidase-related amidase
VDLQNDFIDGSLGTKEAVAILPAVVSRLENCDGETILVTQDTHFENYLSTAEGKKLPVEHCIKNSHGWKINESILNALDGRVEKIFEKPVFGSYGLLEYIKQHAHIISSIEILGLCTDICVISNAIILKNALPETEIYVNEKCCAGVTPQSHNEALNVMKMCQINII